MEQVADEGTARLPDKKYVWTGPIRGAGQLQGSQGACYAVSCGELVHFFEIADLFLLFVASISQSPLQAHLPSVGEQIKNINQDSVAPEK